MAALAAVGDAGVEVGALGRRDEAVVVAVPFPLAGAEERRAGDV